MTTTEDKFLCVVFVCAGRRANVDETRLRKREKMYLIFVKAAEAKPERGNFPPTPHRPMSEYIFLSASNNRG